MAKQPSAGASPSRPGGFKLKRGMTLETGLDHLLDGGGEISGASGSAWSNQDPSTGDDTSPSSRASQKSRECPLEAYASSRPNPILVFKSTAVTKPTKALKRTKSKLDSLEGTSIPGIQGISMKGTKAGPNQDCYAALRTEDFSLYIVCDGHGKYGHDVSTFVRDRMPPFILQDDRMGSSSFVHMKGLMEDAFRNVTDLINDAQIRGDMEASRSGTTATVVIHDHRQKVLTIAHVGDSGAAIARGNKNQAQYLTPDHKPNSKKEKKRIETTGGSVFFDGYNHRVTLRNGYGPQLNMSRSFGDLWGKAAGIISEPDVVQVKLKSSDQFLVMCSDGVWEFMDVQEVANIVADSIKQDKVGASRSLACAASDRWAERDVGSIDDITVLLVFLQEVAVPGEALGTAGLDSSGTFKGGSSPFYKGLKRTGTKDSLSSASQMTESTGAVEDQAVVQKSILKRSNTNPSMEATTTQKSILKRANTNTDMEGGGLLDRSPRQAKSILKRSASSVEAAHARGESFSPTPSTRSRRGSVGSLASNGAEAQVSGQRSDGSRSPRQGQEQPRRRRLSAAFEGQAAPGEPATPTTPTPAPLPFESGIKRLEALAAAPRTKSGDDMELSPSAALRKLTLTAVRESTKEFKDLDGELVTEESTRKSSLTEGSTVTPQSRSFDCGADSDFAVEEEYSSHVTPLLLTSAPKRPTARRDLP